MAGARASSAVPDFYYAETRPCRPELWGPRGPCGHQDCGYGLGLQTGHLGAPLRRPGAAGAGAISSVGPGATASDKALESWPGSRPGRGRGQSSEGGCGPWGDRTVLFPLPLGRGTEQGGAQYGWGGGCCREATGPTGWTREEGPREEVHGQLGAPGAEGSWVPDLERLGALRLCQGP